MTATDQSPHTTGSVPAPPGDGYESEDELAGWVPPRQPIRLLAPLLGLLIVSVVWETYVRITGVSPLVLPAPSRIVRHIASDPGFYLSHGWVTLWEAMAGLVLALVLALAVATVMAHSRFAERATMPVIVLIQSTPVAVLAPVFLLWFGFSPWPRILVAMLFTFVPLVSNALTGLRSVDHDTLEVLRSVDASKREIFWHLRLPNALPALFAVGRIAMSLALVGAVIGEMYGGSDSGLGRKALQAISRNLVDQLWGSVLALALMGVVLTLGVMALEQRVLRWHSSQSHLD